MNRKREAAFMGIGILASFAMCGPATHATANFAAKPSSQPIYVDDQRVAMTAYSIAGSNYVKLRNIGRAVDFGVTYDSATNSVHIGTDAHYQEEPATSFALTEKSVQTTLWGLRDVYPTDTFYGEFYRSNSNGPYGMTPNHCADWATLCSDAAFGILPWRCVEYSCWEDIRAGDLVAYDNDYGDHVVVVLDKTDGYILTTEGGTNSKARWGGQYFRW